MAETRKEGVQCKFCKRDFSSASGTFYKHQRECDKNPAKLSTVKPAAPAQPIPAKGDVFSNLKKAQDALKIQADEMGTQPIPQAAGSIAAPSAPVQIDAKTAAKFMAMPFLMASKLTGCERMALEADEEKQIGEMFKPVFDQYAPAWLQQHGAMVDFLFGFTNIIVAKGVIYAEWKKQNDKRDADKSAGSAGTGSAGSTDKKQ